MKEALQELCSLHGMTLLTGEPLSRHTTFRIGGVADYWAEISSVEGLRALMQLCRREGYPYYVLGKGSNVLAADEGYRGIVLHLGSAFANITLSGHAGAECKLTCEAGAPLVKAAKTAASFGLTGMEGLSGIPGTVGGALYMNAGAYGYEMKDVVSSCTYLDTDGEIRQRRACDLELSYRHSWFTDNPGIILDVTFRLGPGDREEIEAKMQELLTKRGEKQPLELPSAGSTFKRPEGSYASLLIDRCGLKGYTVGGAQVSEKHAGFVVNTGDATCADVLALCSHVHDEVLRQTGYVLELEPVLLGQEV